MNYVEDASAPAPPAQVILHFCYSNLVKKHYIFYPNFWAWGFGTLVHLSVSVHKSSTFATGTSGTLVPGNLSALVAVTPASRKVAGAHVPVYQFLHFCYSNLVKKRLPGPLQLGKSSVARKSVSPVGLSAVMPVNSRAYRQSSPPLLLLQLSQKMATRAASTRKVVSCS